MKLTDSRQFELALTKLASELVHANVFYKLFQDVTAAFGEFQREVRESPTFWALVQESLRESASIRLCRIYDGGARANSLPNVLLAIKAYPQFFDLKSYSDRMKDNEHVDPEESHQTPDAIQLEEDIVFASEENPAVKKLVKWRNNIFAHRSSKLVVRDMSLPLADLPTYGDLSNLLESGMTIVNRYTRLFRLTSYSTQIVGHDDFKYIFKSLRNEAIRRKELLRLEYEKHGEPFPEEED